MLKWLSHKVGFGASQFTLRVTEGTPSVPGCGCDLDSSSMPNVAECTPRVQRSTGFWTCCVLGFASLGHFFAFGLLGQLRSIIGLKELLGLR